MERKRERATDRHMDGDIDRSIDTSRQIDRQTWNKNTYHKPCISYLSSGGGLGDCFSKAVYAGSSPFAICQHDRAPAAVQHLAADKMAQANCCHKKTEAYPIGPRADM